MNPAKKAEPIEMPFGCGLWGGAREPGIRRGGLDPPQEGSLLREDMPGS